MSQERPDLRASDAERDGVVAALRRHALAGRLDTDELEERIAAALAARTLGELAAVTADLPGAPVPARVPSAPAPAPDTGGVGFRHFHQQHVIGSDRRTAFGEAVRHVLPLLHREGYELVTREEPALLVLEARERPLWVPLLVVFAFPFGLLALLARTRRRLVLTFDEHGEHTLLTVQGEARRTVRRAFAELRGS